MPLRSSRRRERLLADRGNRTTQLIEPQVLSAEFVEHLQRPLVEHLVEQFAVRCVDLEEV
jgi:hypothetical protein